MNKLKKYTLSHAERRLGWNLVNDNTNKRIRHFENKEEATTKGVLRRTLGQEGGSVKIKKLDGKFQEERTFPRSKDPKVSKG